MSDANSQAREYLSHYLSYGAPPKFAVMIAGEWGSGKTWFIKSLLQELQGGDNDLIATYVSVAGMRGTSQVDEALFHELYPGLSDPKLRLLGKVATGLLRTTMSIDLEKEFGGDSTTAKAIRSSKLDADLHSNVIVFDDFERCQIDPVELLGYVNRFVETLGCKVILVCNEDKVSVAPPPGSGRTEVAKYEDVKEKVVGATLRIEPDLGRAVMTFIDEVPEVSARRILHDNIESVSQIFHQDGNSNLRVLRHSIFDFGRVLSVLRNDYIDNNDLIEDLVKEFFSLSLCVSTRKLYKGDIELLSNIAAIYASISMIPSDQEPSDQDARIKSFADSHSQLILDRSLVPMELWAMLFDRGWLEKEGINVAIANSRHFESTGKPLWKMGVDLIFESDLEATRVVSECLAFLKSKEPRPLGECFHIFGALLFAVDANLISMSAQHIVRDAKRYIDRVYKSGRMLETAHRSPDMVEDRASLGYQYHKADSAELKGIYEYYRQRVGEAVQDQAREFAESFLIKIKENHEQAAWSISDFSGHQGEYSDQPLLHHVPIQGMLDALMDLPTEERCVFISILDRRYRHSFYLKDFIEEADWLRSLSDELKRYSKDNPGTISAYHASRHAEGISSMAARVDNAYHAATGSTP